MEMTRNAEIKPKQGAPGVSIAEIKLEILAFQERIQKAQQRLETMPTTYLPYPEYKKVQKKGKALRSEITHVKGLIRLAREGIKDRETGRIPMN